MPLVNNQPNRCLVESLNKNSAFLQHLDNDFNKMISGKGPKVVSFYETEESPTAAQVRFESLFSLIHINTSSRIITANGASQDLPRFWWMSHQPLAVLNTAIQLIAIIPRW